MSLSVSCPDCSQPFQVQPEHAGKKFRCKSCGSIVTAPSAEGETADNPWDELGPDLESGQVVSQHGVPLPPRKRRVYTGAALRSETSPGGEMPLSVKAAFACEGILLLLNISSVILQGVVQNNPGACGSLIRVFINAAAIYGYLSASNVMRWISVVLSGLGILGMIACAGLLVAGQSGFPPEVRAALTPSIVAVVLGVLGLQIAMLIAIIVCLLRPSANEYFN